MNGECSEVTSHGPHPSLCPLTRLPVGDYFTCFGRVWIIAKRSWLFVGAEINRHLPLRIECDNVTTWLDVTWGGFFNSIVVRVYHQGRPSSKVNILLPPVADIVLRH